MVFKGWRENTTLNNHCEHEDVKSALLDTNIMS